ncbi:MAG TPA: ribonuclease H-like domain-containing protein [Smithellaceae bacterium]|nr:ribonuclease H-like domain-containing protein [Smithellaceae bacterium]HRS90149.1 ribonuclease H-like domain-containing protein [Smithellaceae bacterium]HRV26956.1 ribonuclease H-like domain-containing protein [Smithellaceae bacterium]
MSSIDKLKRLTGEKTTKPIAPSEKQARIDDLRRRMDMILSRRPQAQTAAPKKEFWGETIALEKIVRGEEVENRHGKFFLASDIMAGSCRHGKRNICEALNLDMHAAAVLAGDYTLSNCRCEEGLFLDTETTGLAGGTGTIAFLIGLGWFEEGAFHIRQIFARDFSEERAALAYLAEIAAQKNFLVTFNGKAFDVNLLSTRFIMNRLKSDLVTLPHLDLLHPSRRILGHRLENSKLGTLEAEVLGVFREGDIPGWEIPQRYFDWLKQRDGRLLESIFEHNKIDVISMATLTAHLTEILCAKQEVQNSHADDYLAAARLLFKRRETERAGKILDVFNENQAGNELSHISKKELASLYKRTGRWEKATQIWQELLQIAPADFSAVSEMAKWLEHRARDYNAAKMLVESALSQNNVFSPDEKESLAHRLKRLKTKSEKTN